MLTLKNVRAFYGDVQILYDVSLDVEEGETVTLLGSNGAGKSTTIKGICNINPIKSGEIWFDGKRIDKMPAYKLPILGIALVPEGRHLFPAMSVKDNLLRGGYTRKDKKDIEQTLEEVVQYFPRLKERFNQSAGTLSGGEQQMCAIGRGLMIRPKLMILDEPSLGLAPVVVDQIFDILNILHERSSITVLLVEQNAQLALENSDRAYVLENGHVTVSGAAGELLHSEAIQKAYLGL